MLVRMQRNRISYAAGGTEWYSIWENSLVVSLRYTYCKIQQLHSGYLTQTN